MIPSHAIRREREREPIRIAQTVQGESRDFRDSGKITERIGRRQRSFALAIREMQKRGCRINGRQNHLNRLARHRTDEAQRQASLDLPGDDVRSPARASQRFVQVNDEVVHARIIRGRGGGERNEPANLATHLQRERRVASQPSIG